MKKILKEKSIWILLLSIITTISISITVVNSSFRFQGNDFRWVLLVIVLYIIFNKALENCNKRLLICSRNLSDLLYLAF